MVAAVLIGVLVSACAPPTPQTRIREHPGKFSGLSEGHQRLVSDGRITTGMPADAVFLAWGAPSRAYQGAARAATRERWDYTGIRPVHVSSTSFGHRHGPYWPAGSVHCDPHPVTEVAYLPYRSATVWFEDGLVDSWERER